jgi:spore maturation protein CgeB
MRIYQCIHKYSPHIPLFENKYGVTDDMDFDTLRRLIVDDGYASTYILQPALEHKPEEVFFTIWDYERLQWKWAEEKGMTSRDLQEIKLAQIEEYQPDVFYNMSAFCDGHFINRLGKNRERIDVYWNGIIESTPRTFLDYDGQLSLHRPYIDHWRKQGLKALELQPGIPDSWAQYDSSNKSIDVLFYGQYLRGMFNNRNRMVEDLLRYKIKNKIDLRCHLSFKEKRLKLLSISKLPWARVNLPIITFPSKLIRKNSLQPLYGQTLYQSITNARIVVNAYTDDNKDYKSNMRLYEATGLGAFLISEEGTYPDGFAPGFDFYTYRNSGDLIEQIHRVLDDWPAHEIIAKRTQHKVTQLYSKKRQWQDFLNFIESL